MNKVSKGITVGVMKTIMPCVEGDRSDYKPSTTTNANRVCLGLTI